MALSFPPLINEGGRPKYNPCSSCFWEKLEHQVQEIGDGMNFKRKKFLKIMDAIQNGEISKLLIAHKDRLVRFGFDYFEPLAMTNGCEIIVVNQESLSPQQVNG